MSHVRYMREKGRLKNGFTLIEIMIVVCIISLLGAICIPNLLKNRDIAQQKLCIDNLRVLDGAKQQWALENKITPSQTPGTVDILPYLYNHMPLCPADIQHTFDSSYSLNDLKTVPECKIAPASHIFN